MNKTEGIKTLEDTIVILSLLSTGPINNAWASVTGEDPMSWKSNFIVRSELLWFFLHMLDRYAFEIGGSRVRDTLIDAITQNAIEGVVIASFDSSNVKEGFDDKKWQRNITISALEEFNEAQIDYSSCKGLGAETISEMFNEETILDKLAARISRLTEQEYNYRLRLLIRSIALEWLAKSGLRKQVEKACSILR
jgi:hypothetical protein